LTLFEEAFNKKSKKVTLQLMPTSDMQDFQSYSLSANTSTPTATGTLVFTISPTPTFNWAVGQYGTILLGNVAGQNQISIPNALTFFQSYGFSGSIVFYAYQANAGNTVISNGVGLNLSAPPPPQTKNLSVSVTDNTGAPVPGCQVGVTTTSDSPIAVANTDANGYAVFYNLPIQSLRVFATYQAVNLQVVTNTLSLSSPATSINISLNFNYALSVQAGRIIVTPPPPSANFAILSVIAIDRVTGHSYQWSNGSWNSTPYITPGAGNLSVTVSLRNNGGAGPATVTVAPSQGSAQTTTTDSIGSGVVSSSSLLYFDMASSALTLVVSVTP
jgi:hypothetical protein